MEELLKKWNLEIECIENDINEIDMFSRRNDAIERELDKYVIELMKITDNKTALSIALKIKSNKINRHDKKLKHFKSLYYARQITMEQFDRFCCGVEQEMRATFELAS